MISRLCSGGPFLLTVETLYFFPPIPMKSVNRVILLGNVTRDAETKVIPSGKAVCTFGLATDRVWKDAQGERQKLPEYHTVVAWGRLAEFCGEHVTKGKPLYVEGRLRTHQWEKPEGQKHYRTEVVLENVTLLGTRVEQAEAEESDTVATEADEAAIAA